MYIIMRGKKWSVKQMYNSFFALNVLVLSLATGTQRKASVVLKYYFFLWKTFLKNQVSVRSVQDGC